MPYDYAGCLHMHTTASDGSGHFMDLVEAAQDAGLDYLVLSDHESMKWRRAGGEGWYGSTFVMVGQEYGREQGHYLGIGLEDNIPTRSGKARRLLKETRRQDAGAILLHPDAPGKAAFGIRERRYVPKRLDGLIGIEIWNYMYDWIRHLNWINFPWYYLFPHRAVTGPSRDALEIWDRLAQRTPITAIGGLDVHQKQPLPFNIGPIFSYDRLFKTVRTHLVTEIPWNGDIARDRLLIEQCLRNGRVFIANDDIHPATGFEFWFETAGARIEMGAETKETAGTLHICLPAWGEIRLLRDGQTQEMAAADRLQAVISAPGVYRVEVRRAGQPWIFSNPVYVRARGAGKQEKLNKDKK